MIGLDYLVAGYFHLASDVQCKTRKPPQITVSASDASIHYDHSKTQNELSTFDNDTISPYPAGSNTHIEGLMNGEIGTSYTMKFYQVHYPTLNAGCTYLDSVNVNIKVKPTIYIASDYREGSCMYRAIMEHEKKHIAVDRLIITKFDQMVTRALNDDLAGADASSKLYNLRDLPASQKIIEDHVGGLISSLSAKMTQERREKQQQVDTLQEYRRVQRQCEGGR